MKAMMKAIGIYLLALLAAVSSLSAWAGTVVYYHNDIAGSPVVATDASRNVLWRESYRPYGERLTNATASAGNKIWFTSRRQDAETGLVYMGARYYDPVVGRFISKDPVGFDEVNLHSHNRYAYANNNPYRFKDPDGRAAETIFDAVSFGISVAMFKQDPSLANFIGAAVDGVAVAVPFVPGGVGAIRAATAGGDAVTAIAKEVTLSRSVHGEAAQHAADAIAAGKQSDLTIDRLGAEARRAGALSSHAKVPGKHLDEYPPAMFKEGGAGASVRAISAKDNMSAGACIGNACRELRDGARIRIKVDD